MIRRLSRPEIRAAPAPPGVGRRRTGKESRAASAPAAAGETVGAGPQAETRHGDSSPPLTVTPGPAAGCG